jgi:hypothetical protein
MPQLQKAVSHGGGLEDTEMRARYEQALADAEAFENALQQAQDYHDVRLLPLLSWLLSGCCVWHLPSCALQHAHLPCLKQLPGAIPINA